MITFVPFAIAVLKMAGMEPLVLPVVVLQTIAANLGSMLTPVGNPQNLYLYSKADLNAGRFMELMAPYTAVSFGMLVLCLAVVAAGNRMPGKEKNGRGQGPMVSGFPGFSQEAAGMEASGKRIYLGRLFLYLFLFLLSLGCVARILPWQLLLAVVITGVWIADRSLFLAVDYSLLLTFCAFLYLSAIWEGCRLSAGSWAGFWRAGKSSPVWAPARLSAMCPPPFCCPDFPGTTVP